MPGASAAMQAQLGRPQPPLSEDALNDVLRYRMHLRTGMEIAASSNLFPRLEMEKEEAPAKPKKEKKTAPREAPAKPAEEAKAPIEFADFQKLDLRVGHILSAKQHPNADKLLCFEVDLGEEKPRQIVSGIAAHFKPEDLVGSRVVVVANLPPRKLRGVESQGMILTAEFEGKLALLSAEAPAGASIA